MHASAKSSTCKSIPGKRDIGSGCRDKRELLEKTFRKASRNMNPHKAQIGKILFDNVQIKFTDKPHDGCGVIVFVLQRHIFEDLLFNRAGVIEGKCCCVFIGRDQSAYAELRSSEIANNNYQSIG